MLSLNKVACNLELFKFYSKLINLFYCICDELACLMQKPNFEIQITGSHGCDLQKCTTHE